MIDTLPAFLDALLSARASGSVVAGDAIRGPHAPHDFDSAYLVQAAVAQSLRTQVVGWKAGFDPSGTTAVAAPLFPDGMRAAGGTWKLPAAGLLIVEVEMAMRLAHDLPPRPDRPYAREEILDAVDEVLVGIELIAGRVGESGAVPYPVFLADNLGNAGYVIGDATRAFRDLDLRALRCSLSLGGAVVHDRQGGHPQGDPIEPLRAWASAPRDRLGGLRVGQIVTTGSLTGAIRLRAPAGVDASIEGIGAVTLAVEA